MKAQEIMTANPEVVTPDEPLSRAAGIMRSRDVGLVPVVSDRESMRPAGVITDRDIVVRHVAEGHRDDCPVQAHMTSQGLDTVKPEEDVDRVAEVMKRDQVRRVLVTDEGGRLVGVIAQADLAVKQAGDRPERVADVVERISEPARPSR
jgi:CBS domain-containing protein